MFGLLNVYKPTGVTSYDVIRHVRRQVRPKLKVGHAGTLYPLADGVLMLCLGPATRLAGLLQDYEKEYVVTARLGAVSTTDDAEGEVSPVAGAAAPPDQAVAETVKAFVGRVRQVPPAHSAVRVAGRRAYELARQGKDIALEAREVTIHAVEVLRYRWPEAELRVVCGRGTYVRSLVRDLGERLGVGGYCTALTRRRIGPFRAEAAATLEQLRPETIGRLLIPPAEAVPAEARVAVSQADVERLTVGRAVASAGPLDARNLQALAAVDPAGRLVALVRYDGDAGQLCPVKVFRPTG